MKELLEITRACGYEHPCQLTMDDVDVNLGDKNLTQTLADVYGYNKEIVPFTGTASLMACPDLGSNYNKANVGAEINMEDVRY